MQVGELWVQGGPRLPKGYYLDPEKTKEAYGAVIAGEEVHVDSHLRNSAVQEL